MRRFDLRSLRFGDASEVWRRLPVEVDPFVFGGLDYEVADGCVDLLLSAVARRRQHHPERRIRDRGDRPVPALSRRRRRQRRGARRRVRAPRGVRGPEEDEEGYVTSSIVDVEPLGARPHRRGAAAQAALPRRVSRPVRRVRRRPQRRSRASARRSVDASGVIQFRVCLTQGDSPCPYRRRRHRSVAATSAGRSRSSASTWPACARSARAPSSRTAPARKCGTYKGREVIVLDAD